MRFDRGYPSPRGVEHTDRVQSVSVDAAALYAALRREVQGEVRFDEAARAMYSTAASNYRQIPIGVVMPRTKEDVVATVAAARRFGAPILSRGGGTSLAGQCCNVAVVMDFSKYMHGITELDPQRKFARVLPGTVLDDLRQKAEEHHLTFGPDPATHTHCTLGGMIGNNSCGIHAMMAGTTADNVDELEILTYDGHRFTVGPTSDEELSSIIREGGRRGQIYESLRSLRDEYADRIRERFPKIPRRVSGYNLNELLPENGFNVARALVGTESTCVTVLEAKVRLIHSPPCRVLVVLGYPDIYEAGDHIAEITAFKPIGLEGMDERLASDVRKKGLNAENLELLPEGRGWLLLELGGESKEEAVESARALMGALESLPGGPSMRLYDDLHEQKRVWEIRESGLGATAYVPGERPTWEGWEDAAVPPERLGRYLRDFRSLLETFGYEGDLYGHFGQGCVHTRIDFDLTSEAGIGKFRDFVGRAADLVVSHGGSLSGEHGDGQSRGELLDRMFGEELVDAFRKFKHIWDPDNRMNPGKVVETYRLTENLRLGADHDPWEPQTHFRFPDDEGSFARASLRCVGVGKCRRLDSGTMCPSYMATREEEHSTRGRAHLLFELFKGDVIQPDWNSKAVRDALDLCLSCKACKGECPVNVDMATYKSEFLAHYYENNRRPRTAYTMGLVYWWSRLASIAPRVANFISQTPPLSWLSRVAGGMSLKRQLPRFAVSTLRSRLKKRRKRDGGRRVLLWLDTFNNHLTPEIGEAAVDVLENAGYTVDFPRKPLCCGRPLYEYGFLPKAKQLLRQIMKDLRSTIDDGIPIIVLEPSCASVFKDELINLFPEDPVAMRLSESVMLLSELMDRESERFDLSRLSEPVFVQTHCHQGAVLDDNAETRVLERLSSDLRVLDSGCCGMAGAFGFEAEHYEISRRCGERVLLPSIRSSAGHSLILANGFSCREQISQGTGRTALHLAQIIRMAQTSGRRD